MNEDSTQSSNLQFENDHLNSIIANLQSENEHLKCTISRLEYQVRCLKSLQEHQRAIIKPAMIKPTLFVKPTRQKACGKIVPKQTFIYNNRNRDINWLQNWLSQ